MKNVAYLVLENGQIFKGKSFGVQRDVIAEIVFTTGMTGYLETLTDRSYFGQVVVQTFPLIGNYGVIPEDFESDSFLPEAYIVKNWCEYPSNFRSEGDINTFFSNKGIVGLCDIDTRALTKVIRENGVMNGMITDDPAKADLEKIAQYRITKAVESVSTKEIYVRENPNAQHKVALMDFGLKLNIAKGLEKRGCEVTVCPHNTTAQQLKELGVDGIMLSNGPGDPKENVEVIENLKEILKLGIPVFGICLGHQLLALANGCTTEKLKYGHRGANQPVKDVKTGRVYISSQNHGYAVVSSSIDPSIAEEAFINVNDKTCEGLLYKNVPAFSAQFHPEACGGPQDTSFLFTKFIEMMGGKADASK